MKGVINLIKGDRVNLIALDEGICELMYTWVNDPSLRELTGARFPVNIEEHTRWFKNICLDDKNKTFGIQLKKGTVIGIVGFKNIDYISRRVESFIYIGNVEQRGKGYGQEALNLLCNFCFNILNMHKIYCYVFEYNDGSKNLHIKAGFLQEGYLKEHYFRNGKYHDVFMYSRIRDQR